ncbi:MAG: translocation/assembly module TamB domain-containing protein [Armatimonadota bacterium]|nr:translocation/assembly module TamB domain-containing protein [Armatimonadota bacterium]
MLTRTQRAALWILTILPVAVVFIAGAVHFVRQARTVLSDARWVVGEVLSDYLNKSVRMSRARLIDLGVAVIDQLEIADGPTFASGKIVSVRKVVVRYDTKALFFGGARAGALKSVDVVEPDIRIVRLSSGRLNVSELVRLPIRRPGPPFRGTVRIIRGRLSFTDYYKIRRRAPYPVRLEHLNGVVQANAPHVLAFTISGLGRGGSLDRVRVSGKYNSRTSLLESDIDVSDASLPLFVRFFAASKIPDLLRAGTLTGVLGLKTRLPLAGRIPAITGLVRFNDLVFVPFGPRKASIDLSGSAVLTGDGAELRGFGSFAGTRFGVSALVSDYRNPKVNITVSSARVNISRIVQALGISPEVSVGSLAAIVRAAGVLGNTQPRSLPHSWKPRLAASNLLLSASYRRGAISVDSFRFSLYGARVRGSAAIRASGSSSFEVRGSTRGLRVGTLGLPSGIVASGILDMNFEVSGTARALNVLIEAGGRRILISGLPIDAFSIRVAADARQRSVIFSAGLNAYKGLVRFRGIASPRKIDIAYSAEGLDVGELGHTLGSSNVSGTAYLVGRVFGKPTSPIVVGTAEIFDGVYGDYATDYARAAFSTDLNRLNLTDAVISQFPSELRFSAHAMGLQTDRVSVSGEAHFKRFETERLLQILNRSADLEGALSGDFEFSGAFALNPRSKRKETRVLDLLANGSVRLDDGSAFGFLISSAYARVSFSKNELVVSDLNVMSDEAQLSLSGGLNLDTRQIHADFSLTGFETARLREKLGGYVALSGIADLKGTVAGSLDALDVAAKAKVRDLSLNGIRFDTASLDAAYHTGSRVSAQLNLTRDTQVFQLKAQDVDFSTAFAPSLVGEFSNVFVPDLRAMLVANPYFASQKGERFRRLVERMPPLTDGRLNGRFEISGFFRPSSEYGTRKTSLLDQFQGTAHIEGMNIAFDTTGVESFVVDVSASEGALYVNKAEAVAGDTYASIAPLTAGEALYKNGDLALQMVVSNLRLDRLRSWVGGSVPGGLAALEFIVQGNAASPDIRGSVEIVEPSYGVLKFNSMRVSQMRLSEDRLDLGEVLISRDGHQAVVEGYLPWDWGSLSVPLDKHFEVAFRLRNGDLSILHTLSPFIQDTPATAGPLQAELKVEGTLSDYKLSGSAKVDNGAIALKNFTNTFTDVKADVVFDGKYITFNNVSARSSSGGTIFIEPGSSIALTSREQGYGQINIDLRSLGLVVEEKGLLELREAVRAQIDGALTIKGTLLEPRIGNALVSGFPPGITVSNALVWFAIPERKKAPSFLLPFRAALEDVRVNLGDRVRVRPPQMDLIVRGGGVITGVPSEKMSVNFDITVQQGTMRLATSRLKITPGARMSISFEPPAEAAISVAGFEAKTNVAVTGILGKRERYTITVQANGPVSNLNIVLKSSPEGLSREQILAALGHVEGLLGSGSGDFQKEFSSVLKAVGTTALLVPVEKIFTEELGFEEFTIESGAYTPLSLYITRRLFGFLDVSYYQRLQASLANVQDTEWQVRVGVNLKKFYSLSTTFDSRGTVSGEVTFNKTFDW